MKIGAMELIVIFIVALLVIGPDKLPSYAKKFGNALREFRKASADMTQDIRESVVEPLEEAQRPLREAMEPLEELKKDVEGNLKGVEKDIKGIGKAKPKEISKDDADAESSAIEESQDKDVQSEGPSPDVQTAAETQAPAEKPAQNQSGLSSDKEATSEQVTAPADDNNETNGGTT